MVPAPTTMLKGGTQKFKLKSTPKGNTEKKNFRRNGTFVLFIRRNEIRWSKWGSTKWPLNHFCIYGNFSTCVMTCIINCTCGTLDYLQMVESNNLELCLASQTINHLFCKHYLQYPTNNINPITPTRMRKNQSRSHQTRIEKMAILYLVDL